MIIGLRNTTDGNFKTTQKQFLNLEKSINEIKEILDHHQNSLDELTKRNRGNPTDA